MVELNNKKLQHKNSLFIGGDGVGRLVIPKLIINAMRLKNGNRISQVYDLDDKTLVVKPISSPGGGHG